MTVVVDIDLAGLLQKLGASAAVLAAVKKHEIKATFTPSGTTVQGTNTKSAASLLLPSMLAYKAYAGKATTQEKMSVAGQLLPAIFELIDDGGYDASTAEQFMVFETFQHGPGVELAEIAPNVFAKKEAMIEVSWPTKTEVALAPTPEAVEQIMKMAGAVSAQEMVEAPAGSLAQATKMYQPVKGTGDGTRYHVVALGDGLNVAARIKGGVLTVRVEGKKYLQLQEALKKAKIFGGPDGTVAASHMAAHLPISDFELIRKTVGAVIGSLPVTVRSPMPDLKLLLGKGA